MREADELSRVIGDIYDASLDPALWPEILETACAYVGGCAANLHSQDSISRTANSYFSWGSDVHYRNLYLETSARLNPLFVRAPAIRRAR